MAAGWSTEATRALIAIWGEEIVQEQLDSVSWNRTIFKKIAASLRAKGFTYNYKQWRTKVKNLTAKYRKVINGLALSLSSIYNLCVRKVKDSNDITGNNRQKFVYFEPIDAILGTRATSRQVVLVENTTGLEMRNDVLLEGLHIHALKVRG